MKPELCVARAGFRVLGRRSVKGATVLTAKTFASRKMPDSKTALCYSFLVRLPPLARRFGISAGLIGHDPRRLTAQRVLAT